MSMFLRSTPRPSGALFRQPAALALALAALTGCDASLGVVGGTNLNGGGAFSGLTNATVLSPTTVRLSWNSSSQYNNYSIFSSSSTVALGSTIFSSFTVTGLSSGTPYSFSVGGSNQKTGSTGDGTQYPKSVTTWPQFTGLASLVATSPYSLQASWNFPEQGPTFRVYVVAGTAAPVTFTTPAVSTNQTTVGITQLSDGSSILPNTNYTVVVRATYLDDTGEYNLNSITVKTPSNISPIPTVTVDPVTLGNYPTMTVSGGLSSYTTSFRVGATLLGTLLGNGNFKAPTTFPVPAGTNVITPTVTAGGSSVQLPDVTTRARVLEDTMREYPAHWATGAAGAKQTHGPQGLGWIMTSGDFNCDGYADLAASAPKGLFNPIQAQAVHEGGVYVFYGTPTGLKTAAGAPSTVPDPQFLTRPTTGSGKWFGLALAAGNLNGDTVATNACDDLAIGANSNETWVYFGGGGGLQTGGFGSFVTNANACSGASCSPLLIQPVAAMYTVSPYAGLALAIGRVHKHVAGTVYADLVIGAPAEQEVGKGRGSIFIYYGGSQGVNFTNPPSLALSAKNYTKIVPPVDPGIGRGETAISTYVQGTYTNFGWSIGLADMDNDGIKDLVVGAPNENGTGGTLRAQGAIYYYGSRPADNNLNVNIAFHASADGSPPVYQRIEHRNPINNNFWGGNVMNAFDTNADGFEDIVVANGVALANQGGAIPSGAMAVYGGSTGPQTTNGCTTNGPTPGPNACAINGLTSPCTVGGVCKFQIFVSPQGGNYGQIALATGSIGGGQKVTAIGWPHSYQGAASRVEVFYAKADNTGLDFNKSTVTSLVTGTMDGFGQGLAIGAFRTPSVLDFAISAPFNNTYNGNQGGVVFAYNGTSGAARLATTTTSYTSLIAVNRAKEGAGGGYATAVGDINGDGFTDIAASVSRNRQVLPVDSPYNDYNQNDVILYYGSPTGLLTATLPTYAPLQATDPTLLNLQGLATPYGFSTVAGAGDANGDGYGDLMVSDTNRILFFYGSATGLQMTVVATVPPTNSLNPVIIAQISNITGTQGIFMASQRVGAMTAGDFNGDGYSDIFVAGTPFTQNGLVVYGSANGPQTDGTMAMTYGANTAQVVLNNPCTGTPPTLVCKGQQLLSDTGAPGDYFGESASAVGDVNGDGYGDLIVGMPRSDIQGTDNGAAQLYYGSQTGLNNNWNGSGHGLIIAPPLLNGAITSRNSAAPVAQAGDVNGDGLADFMLSNWGETYNGFSGGTWVFFGCRNGLNGSVADPNCPPTGVWGVPQLPSLPTAASAAANAAACNGVTCLIQFVQPLGVGSVVPGAYPGSYWGLTLGGVGDLNRDGFADIVIGTSYLNQVGSSPALPGTTLYMGGAVIFTGGASGLSVGSSVSRSPSCVGGQCNPYFIYPNILSNWGMPGYPAPYNFSTNSFFGNPQTSDFNGDGYPDFVLSAPSYVNSDQTSALQGGFYVFR